MLSCQDCVVSALTVRQMWFDTLLSLLDTFEIFCTGLLCRLCWLNVLARCHCNESLLWGSQLNVACGPWLSVPRSKEFDCTTCALNIEAQPNDKVMRTSRSLIHQGSQDRSCRTSLATKTLSVQQWTSCPNAKVTSSLRNSTFQCNIAPLNSMMRAKTFVSFPHHLDNVTAIALRWD